MCRIRGSTSGKIHELLPIVLMINSVAYYITFGFISSVAGTGDYMRHPEMYVIAPLQSFVDASRNQLPNGNRISGAEHNGGAGIKPDQLLENFYKTPMYFGTDNYTIVTTQIGASAHLPCTIHNIGEGVVSWIRRKDYHLLTVALTTYSSDDRYSAAHLKHSEDWTLQVRFVQERDAGLYECQVSTHPPTSIFIELIVIEARAEIAGPVIRYLTPKSKLRLTCKIVQSTEASTFIFWYHDNRMINYDGDRGINVSSEADYHYSELSIIDAGLEHSGNYTCVPSNAQPASVLVHIFKGDNPAAMYHDHRSGAHSVYQQHNVVIAILLWILVKMGYHIETTTFVEYSTRMLYL